MRRNLQLLQAVTTLTLAIVGIRGSLMFGKSGHRSPVTSFKIFLYGTYLIWQSITGQHEFVRLGRMV